VNDWKEGCERCKQILRYGGMGHTMSIHSSNEEVILQFGLKKPAFRIVVNTPTTLGSIGFTTSLDPSMTLGCGGWGGNITSDNISPRHLLNIKRLAWETSPAPVSPRPDSPVTPRAEAPGSLPRIAVPPPPAGIAAASLARRIDQFLASRGYAAPAAEAPKGITAPVVAPMDSANPPLVAAEKTVDKAADFVCEEDVRLAVRQGRKIVIGERSIVTPAARDLGEQHRIFVQAGWRT
jgi:acetaldehyde dehydrogenase (acetylating)